MLARTLRWSLSPLLYHLYVKRKITREGTVRMLDLTLTVVPTVFHPRLFFSSKLLAAHIRTLRLASMRVLDMGTGSGLLALCAAQGGADVTAADINPAAVECARKNAAANGLRIRPVLSDLFEGIGAAEQFDYIIWNPPFYPREAVDRSGYAWYAGEKYAALERFAGQAGDHLRPGGTIVMILTSDMEIDTVLGFFVTAGLTPTLTQSREKIFETFAIYHITRVPTA